MKDRIGKEGEKKNKSIPLKAPFLERVAEDAHVRKF